MSIQYFNAAQCTAMPWKNGGGTTRELACWPLDSHVTDFEWRISIANIDQNGPFSAFDGIDRTIMLLNGHNVRLTAKDDSFDHVLSNPLIPFAFSGETALDCTLLAGSTQDFNVMVRRSKWHSIVAVEHQTTEVAMSAGLIFVAAGKWLCTTDKATSTLQQQDGMWWGDASHKMTLIPQSTDARLITVHIQSV